MTIPTSVIFDLTLNLSTVSADRTDFGALCIITSHGVNTDRLNGPYSNLAEVVAAGFTASAEAFTYEAASKAFAQNNGVERVYIGYADVGGTDADWTAVITAVTAAGPSLFYFVTIESRADADIEDVTNYLESYTLSKKAYMAQSDDLTMAQAAIAKAAGINRTAFWYHDDDTEALDAAIASRGGGKNLDIPRGQSGWNFMQMSVIPPADLTTAQAAAIITAGGNYYAPFKGVNLTLPGKMASGREIRTQITLDWLEDRLGAAFVETVADAGLDISDDGDIAKIVGALQAVLNQGVTFRHLAPASTADDGTVIPAPFLTAPKAAAISQTNKTAGNLVLTGGAYVAKSLEKVTMTVNLQVA